MSQKVSPFSKNKIKKQMYALVARTDRTVTDVEAEIKSKMKISTKQLTYWLENLGEQPTIAEASVLAQILDCSIDDLVENENTDKQKKHTSKA